VIQLNILIHLEDTSNKFEVLYAIGHLATSKYAYNYFGKHYLGSIY